MLAEDVRYFRFHVSCKYLFLVDGFNIQLRHFVLLIIDPHEDLEGYLGLHLLLKSLRFLVLRQYDLFVIYDN